MLNQRQKAILKYLDEETYTTASFIAQQLELSDRTVRSELKQLAEELPDYGMALISKPKFGYRVEILDPVLAGKTQAPRTEMPATPQQRVRFILEYLLAHEDYVKTEELCDLLFLSQSSISQDLKTVREILERYNLKLTVRPHYGLKIEGSEFDYRQCLSTCLTSMMEDQPEADQRQGQLQRISEILETVFEEAQFFMSDFAFNNLAMHLLIALQRIVSGNHVPMTPQKLEELKAKPLYPLAQKIVGCIEQAFSVVIPESECGYIVIHLLGKQMIKSPQQENCIISETMYETVDEMLRVVDDEMNLDLSSDLNLRLVLALHLVPLENRLQYDLNMRNPLLKEIKNHYMLAFMIATTACGVLKERYQKEISEDEIGYIALHINLALERKRETIRRKNIVIVCSTGRGTAELLEYQYRDKFGKYINQLMTCDVLTLDRIDFSDVDLVISTVEIPVKLPVPILRVQYFMQTRDESKIKRVLAQSGTSSIEHFFDPNLFLVNVPAKNKTEVIDYMSARIRNFYKVPRNFKELILLREKKAVTEFGNLIAIPHPYRVCTDETFVCVALLKRPILWDKKKVQLVFLLSIEKGKNRDLQKFYTLTSKFLTSKDYVRLLLHEKRYATLMRIFRTIEEDLNN